MQPKELEERNFGKLSLSEVTQIIWIYTPLPTFLSASKDSIKYVQMSANIVIKSFLEQKFNIEKKLGQV